jgi:hypothetical protein
MNRIGLSRTLPCLAVLTLACLNTINLHAEEILSSTSSSIIQVDESMLPALLAPMSHLVATQTSESATVQDNSLATPRAAVVRAVITDSTPANQLNTDDREPARQIELPQARDFTPITTPTTISHNTPAIPMNFAMMGR